MEDENVESAASDVAPAQESAEPVTEVQAEAAPSESVAADSAGVTSEAPTETDVPEGAVSSAPEGAWSWDSWEGDLDAVPEEHQATARGTSSWYTKQLEASKKEYDELKELYTNVQNFLLTEAGENPVTKDLAEKAKAAEERLVELEAQLKEHTETADRTRTEYEATIAAYQEEFNKQIETQVQSFFKAHPELTSTKANKDRTIQLLDDEEAPWKLQDLPELVSLSDSDLGKVRELLVSGRVSDASLAIKLVRTDKPTPKKRPSPDLVATKASSRAQPNQKTKKLSWEERLDVLASKAVKK
jgi:hypothetical protein